VSQMSFDDVEPNYIRVWTASPHAVQAARAALARIEERGAATSYGDAHIAARWHLRFFETPPVRCLHCPATEATVGGVVNGIHAALDWENAPAARLRIDDRGRVFSISPDLDYIPLCRSCHRRHDSWRKALPAGITAA
jgi:hypothetical protein